MQSQATNGRAFRGKTEGKDIISRVVCNGGARVTGLTTKEMGTRSAMGREVEDEVTIEGGVDGVLVMGLLFWIEKTWARHP